MRAFLWSISLREQVDCHEGNWSPGHSVCTSDCAVWVTFTFRYDEFLICEVKEGSTWGCKIAVFYVESVPDLYCMIMYTCLFICWPLFNIRMCMVAFVAFVQESLGLAILACSTCSRIIWSISFLTGYKLRENRSAKAVVITHSKPSCDC